MSGISRAATATDSTTGTATMARPLVSISQPPGKKNTMSSAAARARISEVVVADRPMWSAQSGTSPLRTDRDALITTTATPSVSSTLRCRAITDQTLACPASRCAERLSEPRSGISSAISPAPRDRTAPSEEDRRQRRTGG